MSLIKDLKENYRYSDFYSPDERYENHLRRLKTEPLSQELVDYLCNQIDDPKSKRSCELQFIHLQPMFLNPTVSNFDLKDYLFRHISKSRRLWLKLFYIRAYSIFANESELIPIMQKFENNLRKIHDYQDYEQILSKAGLPYLCEKYGYECFYKALITAKEEYMMIDPLLRGFFTLDEEGNCIPLLTSEQINKRTDMYLRKHGQ